MSDNQIHTYIDASFGVPLVAGIACSAEKGGQNKRVIYPIQVTYIYNGGIHEWSLLGGHILFLAARARLLFSSGRAVLDVEVCNFASVDCQERICFSSSICMLNDGCNRRC